MLYFDRFSIKLTWAFTIAKNFYFISDCRHHILKLQVKPFKAKKRSGKFEKKILNRLRHRKRVSHIERSMRTNENFMSDNLLLSIKQKFSDSPPAVWKPDI